MNGDNVLYGMFSGMIVGGLTGISPLATGFAAYTMSLIGDNVNGRPKNIKKAFISGITAGMFADFSSSFSNFLSTAGSELFVQIVTNGISSFMFSTYNFVVDAIYDYIRINGLA